MKPKETIQDCKVFKDIRETITENLPVFKKVFELCGSEHPIALIVYDKLWGYNRVLNRLMAEVLEAAKTTKDIENTELSFLVANTRAKNIKENSDRLLEIMKDDGILITDSLTYKIQKAYNRNEEFVRNIKDQLHLNMTKMIRRIVTG